MIKHDDSQMKLLSEIYAKTKYLMLQAERIDLDEHQIYLQPRLEMSMAFDSLMRECLIATKNNSDVDLSSAIKHIYRAFFDVIDWVSVLIIPAIVKELKGFSPEDINRAIPDYYSIMRPGLLNLQLNMSKIRTSKVHIGIEDAENYVQLIEKSLEYLSKIREAKSSLVILKRKSIFKNPWIGIVIGIIGIATAVVTFLIT